MASGRSALRFSASTAKNRSTAAIWVYERDVPATEVRLNDSLSKEDMPIESRPELLTSLIVQAEPHPALHAPAAGVVANAHRIAEIRTRAAIGRFVDNDATNIVAPPTGKPPARDRRRPAAFRARHPRSPVALRRNLRRAAA